MQSTNLNKTMSHTRINTVLLGLLLVLALGVLYVTTRKSDDTTSIMNTAEQPEQDDGLTTLNATTETSL